MQPPVTPPALPSELSLVPLCEENLDAAVARCDESVGKNLYTRSYLASVMDKPEHGFYLLTTQAGQVAGYIYFYVTDLDGMAALAKLPRARLAALSDKRSPVVGNLCSIGVAEPWRHSHLSESLIGFALAEMESRMGVELAVGLGWKQGDFVPVEKTLLAFDFRYLDTAHRVWYDNAALICPYCGGRCTCDAAVYYKPLHPRRKES